ncbi:hypothetical protein [Cognatishimia activa]|uniref:DUF4177 domain-containing protein n=1 Tax=Cognatishimia activa TaxID=1715691 RepID=A0A0P1IPI4_9RHOB|nr:hypothetical protein [Cognatishimia activa]CUJ20648.1 hypothetical protein TA5113_02641 [Cognatishimia activa]CUK25492.1 hypothetical protein TA5114_01291 [Cognatishimia activa]
MKRFEYKVVPAPTKGRKARGVRRAQDKFALSVEDVMNDMALEGWEYQRSETLPHEERAGLTATSTTYRSVLVFRRSKEIASQVSEAEQPKLEAAMPGSLPAPKVDPVQDIAEDTAEGLPVAKDITPKRVRPKPVVEKSVVDNSVVDVDEDDGFFSANPTTPPRPGASDLPAALRQRATQKRAKKDMAAE